MAIEAAATAAVEVADTFPLCRLGRGSLITLPPVVRPRTTRPAVASAAAGEEEAAEARGGVHSDNSHFSQFESPLYASVSSPFFPEEQHYPSVSAADSNGGGGRDGDGNQYPSVFSSSVILVCLP